MYSLLVYNFSGQFADSGEPDGSLGGGSDDHYNLPEQLEPEEDWQIYSAAQDESQNMAVCKDSIPLYNSIVTSLMHTSYMCCIVFSVMLVHILFQFIINFDSAENCVVDVRNIFNS